MKKTTITIEIKKGRPTLTIRQGKRSRTTYPHPKVLAAFANLFEAEFEG